MRDAAWVPLGITFQEFPDKKHENYTFRNRQMYTRTDTFVLAIWTVGTFLLTAAYSGNLKSQFIVKEYEKQIETLQQLLDE